MAVVTAWLTEPTCWWCGKAIHLSRTHQWEHADGSGGSLHGEATQCRDFNGKWIFIKPRMLDVEWRVR